MTAAPDDSEIARRRAEHMEQFCAGLVRKVESVRSHLNLALKMAQMQNGDTLKAKAGTLAHAMMGDQIADYDPDGPDMWSPDDLAVFQRALTVAETKLRAAQLMHYETLQNLGHAGG